LLIVTKTSYSNLGIDNDLRYVIRQTAGAH